MSRDFLIDFLATCLKEQGVEDPEVVAERVASDLRKARIPRKDMHIAERDLRIYELRGKGVSPMVVAERLEMTSRAVQKANKRVMVSKRTA